MFTFLYYKQGEGRAHFEYEQVGPKVGQSYTGPTAEK